MRSAAARVIRGGTTGGAVDATVMMDERLCPGTSMKTRLSSSFVGVARGLLCSGGEMGAAPARRAAARVKRGCESGVCVVFGNGSARNSTPLLLLPESLAVLAAPDDLRDLDSEP